MISEFQREEKDRDPTIELIWKRGRIVLTFPGIRSLWPLIKQVQSKYRPTIHSQFMDSICDIQQLSLLIVSLGKDSMLEIPTTRKAMEITKASQYLITYGFKQKKRYFLPYQKIDDSDKVHFELFDKHVRSSTIERF